jgi:hypothetical protein
MASGSRLGADVKIMQNIPGTLVWYTCSGAVPMGLTTH